jgi:hypothetical protein
VVHVGGFEEARVFQEDALFGLQDFYGDGFGVKDAERFFVYPEKWVAEVDGLRGVRQR